MAGHASITRRAALIGALTSTAALAVPADPAAQLSHKALDPARRVEALMHELAAALDDYLGGEYRAIVEPGPDGEVILQNLRLAREDALVARAGFLRLVVDGRSVTVNPNTLPSRVLVENEDEGWVDDISQPDEADEYLIVDHTGDLAVTRLTLGMSAAQWCDADGGFQVNRRRGWVRINWPGVSDETHIVQRQVTVIGKVVDSLLA